MDVLHWFQNNWVAIGFVGLAVDNLLFAIAPITPWKWDDTAASRLQDLIKKFWPDAK